MKIYLARNERNVALHSFYIDTITPGRFRTFSAPDKNGFLNLELRSSEILNTNTRYLASSYRSLKQGYTGKHQILQKVSYLLQHVSILFLICSKLSVYFCLYF